MKILFICQGNVARSQMAEAYYNYFTKSANASSAGISKTSPAKYVRPVKEVVEVMEEEGIDVAAKNVKTITEEMVKQSDKIFVMCEKEECPSFLLNSEKVVFWQIEGPYNMAVEGFRKIRDIIKDKVMLICP